MNATKTGACQVMSCWRLAAEGSDFCDEHGWQEAPDSNGNGHVEIEAALTFGENIDELEEASAAAGPSSTVGVSSNPQSNTKRRPRGELQRLVLVALADGHRSPAAIGQAVGAPGAQASTVLVKVERKGLAEKVGYGAFVITDAGRETLATGRGLDVARDRNGSRREPRAATEGPAHSAVVAVSDPPVAEEPPRPDNDPEPEPQAADDEAQEAQTDEEIIAEVNAAVLQILDLLDLIDGDGHNEDTLLIVSACAGCDNREQPGAVALFRRLLREELDRYSSDDIADAILHRIDARKTTA